MIEDFRTLMPEMAVASLVTISKEQANALLKQWQHKMGPCNRGNASGVCHALLHGSQPVAVTVVHSLIACTVGGVKGLHRDNCIELARLCAARSCLCRVMLRLWREFVFPTQGVDFACSYQDIDIHTGQTYRFDGWRRVGVSRSGTDTRSGRKGRVKAVWVWSENPSRLAALETQGGRADG